MVSMPDYIPDRKLTAAFRRNIFLIFKEAANNIVKHSGTNKAELKFNIEREELKISIKDFGKTASAEKSINKTGLGLKSMHRRAIENKGELEISFNEGTLVEYRSKI